METTIRRICEMLQSPDGMRRCAAAMVLKELAPKNDGVVKALGAALKDANPLLTRYILEAFEAIGTRPVLPYVLPLLDSEDVEMKLRAAGIVARAGDGMVGELKRHFDKASVPQKMVLMEILARMHGREALQVILETLFDPEFELAREACQAVRRHITDASPQDRIRLHRHVVKFLNTARVKKNERVQTSCLLLIGYIAAPDACHVLLKYTTPKTLGYVRRNALMGLKNLEMTGTIQPLAKTLLKYVGETDTVIVQSALDILEKLSLPRSFASQWRKLLQSKQEVVRSYAARRLAALDDAAINRLMMELLQHNDPQVSEIAASALARHKGATPLLLAALARERHPEAAWRLAKILKPHSPAVDSKTLKKFIQLAGRDLEAGNPRYEALFYFLRNINPKAADTVLRDVGLRFRKSQKWARAAECFRHLIRSESFDAELRYELSLCNLKLSPRDLALHLRTEDLSLRGFQMILQDKQFKLWDRMQQDKALNAADLFYVGFHFCEIPGAESKLGRQLLEQIVKRWPQSKEAKAARNKLKLSPPAPTVAS